MADFLYNYGIECTLWKGQRIKGNLKRSPEDFIVTEIDLSGNLVTLNLHAPIPKQPPPSLLTSVPNTGQQKQEAKPSSSIIDHNESDTPTPNTTLQQKDLPLLLSTQDVSGLHRLSTEWEESVHLAGTADVTQSMVLGCHGDKMSRAAIHLAIRRKFPSLKTSTRKTKEDEYEIVVAPDPAYSSLAKVLGPEESKRFLVFVNTAERNSTSSFLFLPDDSKSHRTEVHRTIDKLFGHLVETKTFTESCPLPVKRRKIDTRQEDNPTPEGEEVEEDPVTKGPQISVRFRSKCYSRIGKKKTLIDSEGSRIKKEWYTKFVLRKENMETLDAIHQLSGLLSCHPSQFSFAGTKDRRAITYQWMTVKNVSAERLSSLSHPLLQCGSYEYVSHPLRLGDLKGNHFDLRITEVQLEEQDKTSANDTCRTKGIFQDSIRRCMSSLESNGFINYYGPQRFGVTGEDMTINSPNIGLAMLQQDPIKAVNLILLPVDGSKRNGSVHEAKSYYARTGDIEGTLSRMPDHRTREIMVLKALKRCGKTEYGCCRALLTIPYQMRLLYIHSFTSLIWNHLTSFRMQRYGNCLIEGDLVLKVGECDSVSDKVHSLTADDIQTSKYTLFDVVLPVPGNNVVLPNNDVKKRFLDYLSEVNLSLSSFKQLHRFSLSVPGTYRKIVAKPQLYSWKLNTKNETESKEYDSDSVLNPSSCVKSFEEPVSSVHGKEEHYLEISFSLESSCYATAMLRELKKD